MNDKDENDRKTAALGKGYRQESVLDYPRPPRLERSLRRAQVEFGGRMIADSRDCFRVLETSHPPVFYFPPVDVDQRVLEPSEHTTFCEWKGLAHYWSLRVGEREAVNAAWYFRRGRQHSVGRSPRS